MTSLLRRMLRAGRRAAAGARARLPVVRLAGLTPKDARAVGANDRLLAAAAAASINQNDRALYNLVHARRLLGLMTAHAGFDVRGATIAEIGASPEPTLPLVLLMTGADRVLANNVLALTDSVPAPVARLYRQLLSLRDAPARPLDEIVTWEGDRARLRPQRFTAYGLMGAEDLPVAPGSVDAVFSLAVLEHVGDLGAVLARSLEILRPGGWCFHAVDLRDHRDFARPLDFLGMTHEAYVRATGGTENRLRARAVVEAFRAAGFDVRWTGYRDTAFDLGPTGRAELADMTDWTLEDFYPRASIEDARAWVTEAQRAGFAEPFRSMDLRELSVLGVAVIARRPPAP